MQDPKLTLRLALYNNWSLTGDLAKANIKFHTGWYDKDYEGVYQVTVTTPRDINTPAALGYAINRVTEAYQIDVWVRVKNVTNYGLGKAKEYLWDIKEEVKSILLAQSKSLTGIMWAIMGAGQELNEPETVTPIFRWTMDVEVTYETT